MLYTEVERPSPTVVRDLFEQKRKQVRFSKWSERVGIVAVATGTILLTAVSIDKPYIAPLAVLGVSLLYSPYSALCDFNRKNELTLSEALTRAIRQITQDIY